MDKTLTTDSPSMTGDSFLKQLTSAFLALLLGAMLSMSACPEQKVDMHPPPEQRAVVAQ